MWKIVTFRTATNYNEIRDNERKQQLRNPHEDIFDIEGPQEEAPPGGGVEEITTAIPDQVSQTVGHRYPRRERQEPDRYGEWVNN